MDKIQVDSVALAGHLNDTLNDYMKKSELCTAIQACEVEGFSDIYAKMTADSTAIYEKIHTDSVALSGQITVLGNSATARMNTISDSVRTNATAIATKANANDVYTKDETDQLLNAKANANDVYTKQQVYTKAEVDALLQQINETLASLPKMNQQDSVIAATQTTTETVFTLAETLNTNCIYRMYINGVMVGGSHNGVLVPVSGEGNKVKYDGTKNGGKTLKEGDKVTIVYWY